MRGTFDANEATTMRPLACEKIDVKASPTARSERVWPGRSALVESEDVYKRQEEMDAAAERHPDIPYDPQLIDATYALLLSAAGDKPLVIPSLNRDGDCLSDLVMQLFGSIAGAESILLAFGESLEPSAVMACLLYTSRCV